MRRKHLENYQWRKCLGSVPIRVPKTAPIEFFNTIGGLGSFVATAANGEVAPFAWRFGSDPASGAASRFIGPRACGAAGHEAARDQHELDPIANLDRLGLALEPCT